MEKEQDREERWPYESHKRPDPACRGIPHPIGFSRGSRCLQSTGIEVSRPSLLSCLLRAWCHATAEDVTQDSFLRVFQNISGFRRGSFRVWILKIVTNTAYDVLRRSKRHPILPLFPEDEYGEEIDDPAWLADPSPSAPHKVEQKEFIQGIYRLLDELLAAYRTILALVDLYALEYEEAAVVLRIPIGTVKSRLARARLRMSERLQSGPEYARTIRLMDTSAKRAVS
jgi:RNA polymerase sigma-70 factor, ECF subfamily